ncbi:DNA replication and repair protein RecF [Actinokineospora soli]|uniref:DNA replication and repair protein RecF n=1 Tax=Actinokineospora soli TaxID=1048753 RepID=A0ABW2TX02_9PSEU
MATLASHRVAADAPLVRHGAQRAIVRLAVVNADRELTVELEITPGKANRARVNRGSVGRPRDVLGILRTVLFAPEDLALVRGDPGERRKFLDDLLVQRAPGTRACARTTTRCSSSATPCSRARPPTAARADPTRTRCPRSTSGTATSPGTAASSWRPGSTWSRRCGRGWRRRTRGRAGVRARADRLPGGGRAARRVRRRRARRPAVLSEALLEAMAARRDAELDRGVSLVGPHRDELELTLGELPAKGYASHGESWSFALSLRLGSYELLRGEGSEPVLILDDVFAELDRARRERLAETAVRAEQVLVTAAVAEDVPGELVGARYSVADGEVRRVR